MNYILFIAYGGPRFCDEAIYSLLTYLHLAPDSQTTAALIYTDSADYFRQVLGPRPDVLYEEISTAQWQQWRGKRNFIHRAKIETILHAARTRQGQFLCLDSDTVFLKSPEPVFKGIKEGQHYMHVEESVIRLGNPLHRELYAFLVSHPNAVWSTVTPNTKMYNSGAIGVRTADVPLLEQVLALTDALVAAKPLHVMEQFAFSLVLAQVGQLHEVAPYVLHYWHMKDLRAVLSGFMEKQAGKPFSALLEAATRLPIVELSRKKDKWENTPRWMRAVLRGMGCGWKIDTAAVLQNV